MRIGIDLGGTKTEVIALSDKGEQLFRHRVNTPRDDYQATVQAIVDLVGGFYTAHRAKVWGYQVR